MSGRQQLNAELDCLQDRVPDWASSMIAWVRHPGAVWVRIAMAVALIVGGVFSILPVLGIWMLPLGLALLALDVPFLRRPLARALNYINRKLG
ncbi:MAG: hypothetical protein GC182_22580 [Rhodopseudomonas sp.]|nr:hypothetical protein [Rhodopseudomonas sp.]